MLEYRLFAAGEENGHARVSERVADGGRRIEFDAAIGTPAFDRALAGAVVLDAGLRWRRLEVERDDGRRLELELEPDVELELAAVPALFGVTTRRLVASGLAPAGRRNVPLLRIDADLRRERAEASYLWLSGLSWHYQCGRLATWLAVGPTDGVVRRVEGAAELVAG